MLAKRLVLGCGGEEAEPRDAVRCILWEAQARKAVHEWTMEDMDVGGNLSSLGTSVMLALLLTRWHGAWARVCVSTCHTAMVAYWSLRADGWVLVDPCNSAANAITADVVDRGPPARHAAEMRQGSVVEVRVGVKWHLAIVEKLVSYGVGSATSLRVRVLHNSTEKIVSLSSRNWRVLARGEDTDAEVMVRRLYRERKETAAPKRHRGAPP